MSRLRNWIGACVLGLASTGMVAGMPSKASADDLRLNVSPAVQTVTGTSQSTPTVQQTAWRRFGPRVGVYVGPRYGGNYRPRYYGGYSRGYYGGAYNQPYRSGYRYGYGNRGYGYSYPSYGYGYTTPYGYGGYYW